MGAPIARKSPASFYELSNAKKRERSEKVVLASRNTLMALLSWLYRCLHQLLGMVLPAVPINRSGGRVFCSWQWICDVETRSWFLETWFSQIVGKKSKLSCQFASEYETDLYQNACIAKRKPDERPWFLFTYRPRVRHNRCALAKSVLLWPHTGYIPTTYRLHTDHKPRPYSDHVTSIYRPHTDHKLTTYRPHTDHKPTTYRPLKLVHYYQT